MAQEHILVTSLSTQNAFTILSHLSNLYITAGVKVLMEIWYSHGDLLASQSAGSNRLSPKLPQAQGILHDLSLQPAHILPIAGI